MSFWLEVGVWEWLGTFANQTLYPLFHLGDRYVDPPFVAGQSTVELHFSSVLTSIVAVQRFPRELRPLSTVVVSIEHLPSTFIGDHQPLAQNLFDKVQFWSWTWNWTEPPTQMSLYEDRNNFILPIYDYKWLDIVENQPSQRKQFWL